MLYKYTHKKMDIKKEIEAIYQAINKKNRRSIKEVANKYQSILQYIFSNADGNITLNESYNYISLLYRLIFETRDIVKGKGEYKFAHMLIGEWIKFGHSTQGQDYIEVIDHLVNMGWGRDLLEWVC